MEKNVIILLFFVCKRSYESWSVKTNKNVQSGVCKKREEIAKHWFKQISDVKRFVGRNTEQFGQVSC